MARRTINVDKIHDLNYPDELLHEAANEIAVELWRRANSEFDREVSLAQRGHGSKKAMDFYEEQAKNLEWVMQYLKAAAAKMP